MRKKYLISMLILFFATLLAGMVCAIVQDGDYHLEVIAYSLCMGAVLGALIGGCALAGALALQYALEDVAVVAEKKAPVVGIREVFASAITWPTLVFPIFMILFWLDFTGCLSEHLFSGSTEENFLCFILYPHAIYLLAVLSLLIIGMLVRKAMRS